MPKKEDKMCCKNCFPMGSVLVFICGLLWLLQELKILAWNVPWLPIIVMLVALKMMAKKKHMMMHMNEMKK
jgi:hypothetical protein